jgi:ribosomal protein L35AE/L33A
MRAHEPCNYGANAEHMSWAGLCKIPNIELSMIRGCCRDELQLENSEDARTAFGVYDADIGWHVKDMQRRHGVRLLDAVKIVDPLSVRLHECLLGTQAGARREMIYRVCFPAQTADTTECEQRRHASLDRAIAGALHVLGQIWYSLCRFRAGVGTPVDAENARVHGRVMVFYVEYASAITEGTQQQTEYENEVLCLYRTTWTVDTEAVQAWQAPIVHARSTPEGTEREQTAEQGGAQVHKQAPIKCLRPDIQTETADVNEGWRLATPMVPHPMHEHKHAKGRPKKGTKHKPSDKKTPKDAQLYVGRSVCFSRRIMKNYGKYLKQQKGVVVSVFEHNSQTYYAIVLTNQVYVKEVQKVNKGRDWVCEKLTSLGLELKHVVCPCSSLETRV